MPVEDEELETDGKDRVISGRDHLPIKGDHVSERLSIVGGSEPVSAVPDPFFVRANDPLLERLIPARLARRDVMKTIRRPQFGDGLPTCRGVCFGPNCDVTIGKLRSLIHDPPFIG